MTFHETLFGKVIGWGQRKSHEKWQAVSVCFDDHFESISILFNAAQTKRRVLLRKEKGIGTITNGEVFFPESIELFRDKKINRKAFLHKALVAGVISDLGVRYSDPGLSVLEKSLECYKKIPYLRIECEHRFLNYRNYFRDLFAAVELADYNEDRASKNFLRFISKKETELYADRTRSVRHYPFSALILGFGLLPALRTKKSHILYSSDSENRKNVPERASSERQGQSKGDVSEISLEKKKEEHNPVMHSFESLHTADEYQGGLRNVDGTDELDTHEEALSELDLRSVTRDKGQAGSVYKASIGSIQETLDSKKGVSRGLAHQWYPEWDYRRSAYRKNHCRLYLTKADEGKKDSSWKSTLFSTYKNEIGQWKRKMQSLVTREIWVKRQWDGPEFDVENYVEYFSDMKSGGAMECPLYLRRSRLMEDCVSLILFDQSYSTDTWVKGRRVLDVELESIGLAGALTETFQFRTAIAGTWSETRSHCFFHKYKDFSEDWTRFYNQAAYIEPRGYTRLGPSIRHGIEILKNEKSRSKLLILLTDGKPTDYDRYEGRYGIEDVYHAVHLGERYGITVRAITIEEEGLYHLPLIFGNLGYRVLSDPAKLPESLWGLYYEMASRGRTR